MIILNPTDVSNTKDIPLGRIECPTRFGPPREHGLIMSSRRGIRQKGSLARRRTTNMGIPQSSPIYGHFSVKRSTMEFWGIWDVMCFQPNDEI